MKNGIPKETSLNWTVCFCFESGVDMCLSLLYHRGENGQLSFGTLYGGTGADLRFGTMWPALISFML